MSEEKKDIKTEVKVTREQEDNKRSMVQLEDDVWGCMDFTDKAKATLSHLIDDFFLQRIESKEDFYAILYAHRSASIMADITLDYLILLEKRLKDVKKELRQLRKQQDAIKPQH